MEVYRANIFRWLITFARPSSKYIVSEVARRRYRTSVTDAPHSSSKPSSEHI